MSTPESTSAADGFLDRALPRILRILLMLAVAGTLACLVLCRWQVTAGFVAGAVTSWLNQRWLQRAITCLGDRITQQESGERGGVIVARALLRYVLVASGAYVILNVSHAALYGFFGGVCLPIAAVACEVAAEFFVMLRRGTP
jgi:hypothetical protein